MPGYKKWFRFLLLGNKNKNKVTYFGSESVILIMYQYPSQSPSRDKESIKRLMIISISLLLTNGYYFLVVPPHERTGTSVVSDAIG